MNARQIWIAFFCLLICTVGLADTLKLKDGTVLEGKVQEVGDKYWIKLTDGSTRMVSKAEVASLTKGDAKPPMAPAEKPAGEKPKLPSAGAAPSGGVTAGLSPAFTSLKAKTDRVDAPMQAVQMWEAFIAKNPTTTDLEAAKVELAKWQQLMKDGAEKIKGKWVAGPERKKIVKQAKNMVTAGVKQIEEGKSMEGFKKIEEALALYPQSFDANFYLGLQYLKKSTINVNAQFDLAHLDKAIKILENASKIAPNASSTWSNLAIGYSFKKRYKESVQTAYKAAQMRESPDTVQNLVTAFRSAPGGMQQQAWCKAIMEDAVLMAQRHNIELRGDRGGWVYLPPAEGDEVPGGDAPAGAAWTGSGFFVTDDGYILTNHHVATGDTKSPALPNITFRIRMDDGTEKTAELLAVDDAADIALMKIQVDSPVVPLKLANYLPPQGSKLMTLGYPATGDDEKTLQISDGSVKSTHDGDEHEVWMNLNTTHGNSGGPIVDAANHMVAIVTAYRQTFNMDIFLGVSTSQIKTFLGKIGDKAPKLEYADRPSTMPEFDSEALTVKARGSTVLIFAVKSSE